MKRVVAAQLPPAAEGLTLLDYLACRFNYHTREVWDEKIAGGLLHLAGAVCCDPERILHKGELLEYFPELLPEPPVNTSYKILYEDEHLFVIDKPGNLPVHPAGAYFNHTLWVLLQEDGIGKVHFVNRLDRETSGVLIAAKSSEIAGILAGKLEEMRKLYYVIVHGSFPEELSAEGFLIKDEKSFIRKKQRFVSNDEVENGFQLPEKAVAVKTKFSLIKSNGKFSLVNAVLQTGRMHQIRATLHTMGYPVAGDKLYGVNEQFYRKLALDTLTDDDRKTLVLTRQALHCCEISFEHPASNEKITLQSPTPTEMEELARVC